MNHLQLSERQIGIVSAAMAVAAHHMDELGEMMAELEERPATTLELDSLTAKLALGDAMLAFLHPEVVDKSRQFTELAQALTLDPERN